MIPGAGECRVCNAILAACVTLLLSVPATARTVALWLFDDPEGSTVAIDSSGNGHHLTIGPGAAIVAGGGRFGGALDADAGPPGAIGAYRDRVAPDLNPDDKSWTLECWLKAKPGISGDNRIFGISGVNYIDYGRGEDVRSLFVANRFLPAGGKWAWPSGDLNQPSGQGNAWHHVAVVYDAAARQIRHFFDGQQRFAAPCRWRAVEFDPALEQVFPPQYPQLQVGMRDPIQQWDQRELHATAEPRKRFGGYIDEMRFSDAALYQANFTPPGTLARPFLRVWPQELSFVVTAHKPDQLPQQTIEISSLGGKVEWSVHSDQPWVKVNREGREDRDGREAQAGGEGAAAKRVIVAVDASALSDGRHRAVLKITPRGIDQPPVDVTIHLSVVAPDGVIDVGARRQLFIDRRFIEQDQNVTLRVHPPQRVAIDFPAPRDGPLYPSGIIYLPEAQVWRMYYPALGRTSLRYVESTDGLRWTLPPGDNVVSIEPDSKPLGPGASVMRDDRDVPDRRYKAFQDIVTDDDNVRGIHAYVSADGVKFTHVGRVLPIPAESHITAMWDPRINKYVAYMRVMNIDGGQRMIQGCQFICRPDGSADAVSRQTGIKPGFENLRAIGRIETDDLLKPWPHNTDAPPTRYLTGRDIPMVLCADEQDGFVDFYNGAVSIYPYAQDVYLAFPSAFRHFHPSRQPQFHAFADANGPLEVQLATSRDGIGWDRHDRAAYLETGLTSEPDRWLNMAAPGFVRAGEWLYQYYWTSGRLHDSIELRPELKRQWSHPTSLFAVRQRLDGFVSASVDHRGGWLTTPPIRFAGSRLLVNHNCNATGTIFVELRDLNDVPIPGYRLSECQEITGNDTGWEVRWRDRGGDVSELAGRPIRIHLRMRNADVYAFQFA